jgi:hypothetical protein
MIPFPKMHIAASVLNRIFNTLDGEKALAVPQPTPMPPIDPSGLGQQIETQVATPPAPAEAPPGAAPQAEAGAEAASLTGGSPFDGALMGVVGP